ncbi:hypothetical protein MESS2_350079 [Mesorhizobium metallidurans STM 2683]|uniref:Uncharacterized protein n=1 Tax=Mesorhizobium metallidurans STM 2683 TaxID=1297569 RepID=M5EQW5_9HYPH|nr:hypothetical protein [Mesorhizobium metallidurans]CCV06707.1 hypothetical protein MESS2_350079 [Mesorhizobium metallidurans STM 2683]
MSESYKNHAGILNKIDLGGGCADFTNLGTNNPKLFNKCGRQKTIKVVNWDKNGNPVATRWFHLEDGRERPVAFPGFQMAISEVREFEDKGDDDGSALISLTKQTHSGYVVWDIENRSPDRWNAISYSAFYGTRKFMDVTYALAPTERINFWGAFEDENPLMYLNWSRLDPY